MPAIEGIMKIGDVVVIRRGKPTGYTGTIVGITDNQGSRGVCHIHDEAADPSGNLAGYDTDIDHLKEKLGILSEATTIYWIDSNSFEEHRPEAQEVVTDASLDEEVLYKLERW